MGNVTRAEFYTAMAGVSLYVMILVTYVMLVERKWPTNVLWVGAFLMWGNFAVKQRRARRELSTTDR